jgi:hypothetical protein
MRFDWRHILIIVAVVSAFGAYAWFNLGEYPTVKKLWFYDLNTCELFVGSARSAPPIAAPSDTGDTKSGVIAQVIRIEGDEERHIVFLQSFTSEAQSRRAQILATGKGPDADAPGANDVTGTLLALPPKQPGDKLTWIDATNPEGIGFPLRAAVLANGRAYREDLP